MLIDVLLGKILLADVLRVAILDILNIVWINSLVLLGVGVLSVVILLSVIY
jgi:hypothetical protein